MQLGVFALFIASAGCDMTAPCGTRHLGLRADAMTTDELFEEVARRVPGFGGLFLSFTEPETALAHLLDPTPEGATAVLAQWPSEVPRPFTAVRAIPGDYDWLQLTAVEAALLATPSPPGMSTSGIDEVRNRVVIGVDPGSDCSVGGSLDGFEVWVRSIEVPRDAVILEWRAPPATR